MSINETTVDQVGYGRLALEQPRAGYRFNVDSLILAHFAGQALAVPPQTVVDLGAGAGVIGLLLARRWPQATVYLVEKQPRLADLCAANVLRNALDGRVHPIHDDLRTWLAGREGLAAPVLLVSNPPFYRLSEGRPSTNAERAEAKHELSCSIDALLESASATLAQGNIMALIHDFRRADELVVAAQQSGLGIVRRRRVLPLPGRVATRILLLLGNADAARQPEEVAPLIIHQQPGVYSTEMAALFYDA